MWVVFAVVNKTVFYISGINQDGTYKLSRRIDKALTFSFEKGHSIKEIHPKYNIKRICEITETQGEMIMGAIAIRIYLGGITRTIPMADIKTSDGTIHTIEWANSIQRERFRIDGYTLFYDERPKREWKDWL